MKETIISETSPDLRSIEYEIPEEFDGYTVGKFLKLQGYSKSLVSFLKSIRFKLVKSDKHVEDCFGIMCNQRHVYTNFFLHSGDLLSIHLLETEESEHVLESKADIQFLYEDADIQVINKSGNMPIHPSWGHYLDSLGNALSYHAHHVLGKAYFTLRIINRLDRETSGLLISAKNMLSAGLLGNSMLAREIHREYLAICTGNPMDIMTQLPEGVSLDFFPSLNTSETNDPCLKISAPILDSEDMRMIRRVDFEKGNHAVSYMQVLSYDEEKDISLVKLKLETGRTHQIRVHMKYIGHPLIGDSLYNKDFRYIERQALHSHSLAFQHPIRKENLYFSIGLPDDMKKLFPRY